MSVPLHRKFKGTHPITGIRIRINISSVNHQTPPLLKFHVYLIQFNDVRVQHFRYYDSYITTAITIQINRITLHSVFDVEGEFTRKMPRTNSHRYAIKNDVR